MTNHNQLPSTAQTELTPEEQGIFTVAGAEAWRAHRQSSINDQLANMAAQGTVVDESTMNSLSSAADAEIDQYLVNSGLETPSPSYNEIRENFLLAGRITDSAWNYSATSRGEQGDMPSGRDMFGQLVNERSARSTEPEEDSSQSSGGDSDAQGGDTPESTLDPERIAAIDELEEQLDELRIRMAEATAKRQDRFFGKGGKKYEELKTEYNNLIRELGRRHLSLHEDTSEEDKNLIAMTVLFDEQEKLRQKTIEELENKPLGKFIKWMNRGNVATRIAKGVGIGVLAGIGGSFIAGAVGAGIIAGGAVATSRFARNFAIKDNKTRGMASIYSEDGKSSAIDVDGDALTINAALNFADDTNRMEKIAKITNVEEAFEEDTKKEQSKRIKSALFGSAMIGVGAFAGYGIHQGAEWLSSRDLTVTNYLHDKWNDFWYGDTNQGRPDDGYKGLWGADGDRDGDGIVNHLDPDKDGDGVLNANDAEPLNPDVSTLPGDKVVDFSEISHDARWVDPGEGWYQTFQELGIPQDHWNDVLENAGPKLHEQGWAYFDESANEWRISQPGRLPDASLRVIAKAASRDGFDLAA